MLGLPRARCVFCSNISLISTITPSKRWVHQRYLARQAQAEKDWQAHAQKIRAGEKPSMLSMLESRGYIDSIAGNRDALDRLMTDKRIGAYVGVDPTAPSMHIGHLLPFMVVFWLYVHGYHSVSLLGGATARIGDPTGRTKSRDAMSSSDRKSNMINMHYQLKTLWANVEAYGRKHGYTHEWAWHRELVNNNTWINKLSVTELLAVMGSGIRMGPMLSRETLKSKLDSRDGMSFSEFTYPILQSWDWWHMYNTKGVQIQIGGSDQFGNIISGIDSIKYIAKHHPDPLKQYDLTDPKLVPFGFTVPLLTTSSGEKFGKSAGNAIWLDKEWTSVFDLYQFFLRSADADVGRYLKLFTFIPLHEIEAIEREHQKDPPKRVAQHRLASEFVELVHGPIEAKNAEAQHRLLFNNRSTPMKLGSAGAAAGDQGPSLVTSHINQTNSPSANIFLPESCVINQPMARVLYSAGLVVSRSEGNRLAASQGAYIGSRSDGKGNMSDDLTFSPVKLWKPEDTAKYIIDGDLLVLRAGKWKVRIVRILSDEEFERRGLDAPGWKEEEKEAKRRVELEEAIRVRDAERAQKEQSKT